MTGSRLVMIRPLTAIAAPMHFPPSGSPSRHGAPERRIVSPRVPELRPATVNAAQRESGLGLMRRIANAEVSARHVCLAVIA